MNQSLEVLSLAIRRAIIEADRLRTVSQMVHGNAWQEWLEKGTVFIGRECTAKELVLLREKRRSALS